MKENIQIKIKGELDKQWEEYFKGMKISHESNATILTGNIKDEAQLHGILYMIRDLNLKLISVNPLSSNNN
jgi:hypothetical protein